MSVWGNYAAHTLLTLVMEHLLINHALTMVKKEIYELTLKGILMIILATRIKLSHH